MADIMDNDVADWLIDEAQKAPESEYEHLGAMDSGNISYGRLDYNIDEIDDNIHVLICPQETDSEATGLGVFDNRSGMRFEIVVKEYAHTRYREMVAVGRDLMTLVQKNNHWDVDGIRQAEAIGHSTTLVFGLPFEGQNVCIGVFTLDYLWHTGNQ